MTITMRDWLLDRTGEPVLRDAADKGRATARLLRVPTHFPPFCIRAEWMRGSAGPTGEIGARTTNGRGGYPDQITHRAIGRERTMNAEECLELDASLKRLAPWDLPTVDPDPQEVDDGISWWRARERCGMLSREEPSPSSDDQVWNRPETRHLVEIARTLFRLSGLATTTLGEVRERCGSVESSVRDVLSGEWVVVSPGSPFHAAEMSPMRRPR